MLLMDRRDVCNNSSEEALTNHCLHSHDRRPSVSTLTSILVSFFLLHRTETAGERPGPSGAELRTQPLGIRGATRRE